MEIIKKFSRIKKHNLIISAGLIAIAAGFLIYGILIEPELLTVKNETVRLKHWHAEHNNLKIVFLSDIHLQKTPKSRQRILRIIEKINNLKPDLILLGGDYTGSHPGASPAEIAEMLSKLKSRYGIIAVLGNHDWYHYNQKMQNALREAGITVLENQVKTLNINGKSLNILGLPDKKIRNHILTRGTVQIFNAEPTIILSHSPDYFEEYNFPHELMLAAHTHGGQVALPLIGPLVVPSKYYRKYAKSWHESNGRKLFVTTGIGTSVLPIRIGCIPEIVVLNITD